MDDAPRRIDIRAALREDVYEYMGFVRLHAEIIQKWLEVPDDPAAEYAVARLITYVRLASSSMRALRNVNNAANLSVIGEAAE